MLLTQLSDAFDDWTKGLVNFWTGMNIIGWFKTSVVHYNIIIYIIILCVSISFIIIDSGKNLWKNDSGHLLLCQYTLREVGLP